MSYSVRESDRRRDYDYDDRRNDRDRSNFTVRRYHVPDREDDRWESGTHVSTRSRKNDDNYRSSSNVRIERDSRDYTYDSYRDSKDQYDSRDRSDNRDFKFTYESTRDRSPERERDRDYRRSDDYEVEKYTKTTDYYARDQPQQQPQPIYIRNDAPPPIIIRESAPQPVFLREERPREGLEVSVKENERSRSSQRSEHQSVHESEHNQERQLVRQEQPPEEDYYYSRTTREIARRDDDRDLRRGREVQPRESRSNQSDEDYYHREVEEWDEYRDRSPHHRRHLAEGAVVGAGAAALLRNHKNKSGGHGGGVGRVAGGAALGAVGAELITRARSHYRGEKSRERSRGRYRDDDNRERGGRDRSRSAPGNYGTLEKFGAVAAVGALAGYAIQKMGKNKDDGDRRSRSRRRRSSRGRSGSRSRSRSRNASDQEDGHQKGTMAKAGLASAAVAGLVQRVRSKSRGGRSKSLKRQAVPVAVAGLGGAALAGLYESNKTKKKERENRSARSVSRGGSRSRSRSRARSDYGDGSRGVQGDDRGLIEYGGGDVAVDSAAQGRRRGSPGSDDSGAGRRNRQGRDVAGADAHEAAERRERRQAERDQRRQQEDPMQQGGYSFGPYAQAAPEPPPAGDYPPGPYFPGPQNNQFQPVQNAYSPVPNFVNQGQYNSTGFQQQQSAYPPPPGPDPNYGYPQQPPAPQGYPGEDPSHRFNVSEPFTSTPENTASVNQQPQSNEAYPQQSSVPQRRSRSVHFLSSPTVFDGAARADAEDGTQDHDDGRRSRTDRRETPQRRHSEPRERPSHSDRRRGRPKRTDSPTSDDSGETVDLPDRFDSEGRRKPEHGTNPLGDRFEDMLHDGNMGRLLSGLFGPESRHGGR